jgi:hypothetical protein
LTKKKSVFFLIGPPRVAPKMCCLRSGRAAPDRFRSQLFASKSLFR